MNNPKVSIVIPVFNRRKDNDYLIEAIESALSQTYENIEIIVVNDGSLDNGVTKNIALSYGNKIKYYEKENGGVSTALNVALEKMTGDYFSWLSHDDLYYPNKIEENIKFLSKNKLSKNIIMSDFELIDVTGKTIKQQRFNSKEIKSFPIFAVLKTYINGITVLIPKNVFEKVGLFNESLSYTQDYDMWWRIHKAGFQFVHQPKILTKTRIHQEQDTIKENTAVAKQGNKFWMEIFKSISDSEAIRLSGTKLTFFKEMNMVFEKSIYNEVNYYLAEKIKENLKESNSIFDKNKILRFFWLSLRDLKYKGLRNVLGNIYRREYWKKR